MRRTICTGPSLFCRAKKEARLRERRVPRGSKLLAFAATAALWIASSSEAEAQTNLQTLGTASFFGVLAGSTVTNTGRASSKEMSASRPAAQSSAFPQGS
jgi:hypothetical protein